MFDWLVSNSRPIKLSPHLTPIPERLYHDAKILVWFADELTWHSDLTIHSYYYYIILSQVHTTKVLSLGPKDNCSLSLNECNYVQYMKESQVLVHSIFSAFPTCVVFKLKGIGEQNFKHKSILHWRAYNYLCDLNRLHICNIQCEFPFYLMVCFSNSKI